jgi:hypothetical protein
MHIRAKHRERTRSTRTQSSEASSPHPTTGTHAHSPGSRAMLRRRSQGKPGRPLLSPLEPLRAAKGRASPGPCSRSWGPIRGNQGDLNRPLGPLGYDSERRFLGNSLKVYFIFGGLALGGRFPRRAGGGGGGRRRRGGAALCETRLWSARRVLSTAEKRWNAETGAQVCSPSHPSLDRSFIEVRPRQTEMTW